MKALVFYEHGGLEQLQYADLPEGGEASQLASEIKTNPEWSKKACDQLADRLYGVADEVGPNAIEVFVHRLRRKIESAGVSIRTIRGLGYLVEKPSHP